MLPPSPVLEIDCHGYHGRGAKAILRRPKGQNWQVSRGFAFMWKRGPKLILRFGPSPASLQIQKGLIFAPTLQWCVWLVIFSQLCSSTLTLLSCLSAFEKQQYAWPRQFLQKRLQFAFFILFLGNKNAFIYLIMKYSAFHLFLGQQFQKGRSCPRYFSYFTTTTPLRICPTCFFTTTTCYFTTTTTSCKLFYNNN